MIKFAVGTDDGVNFTDNHFGESGKYLIYDFDLDSKQITFVKIIDNSTPEETEHGDAKKANNVGSLLKGISLLVAKVMGLNITRMRKKFVPVMCAGINIEEALALMPNFIEKFRTEMTKPAGEARKIIRIKKS